MKEYWTQDVEEKLAKYVTTKDMDEKNEIFDNHLHVPLKKLIDAILERYRIPAVDDDMKLSILSDLVLRVGKFKPDIVLPSGRKATGKAYCITLIRCWLADWKVKYARQRKNIRIEDWHKDHPEI